MGQPGGDRRGRQGWDDPTGKWPDWLDSAASAVGDGISTAWNSTTEWVDEHQADIVAGVAGAVVGGGCLLLSAGAGSIACGALGGAAAGAASHARRAQIQHTEEFSWGALGREAVIGGATGALTAGVGNALRPVTSRASRQARPALVAGSRPRPSSGSSRRTWSTRRASSPSGSSTCARGPSTPQAATSRHGSSPPPTRPGFGPPSTSRSAPPEGEKPPLQDLVRTRRSPQLGPQHPDHPHRRGLLLRRAPTRRLIALRHSSRHGSIPVSKVSRLRLPQGGSVGTGHWATSPAGDPASGARDRARHLGRVGSTCAVATTQPTPCDVARRRDRSRWSEPDVVFSRSERSFSRALRDGGQRDAQRVRRGQRLAPARK